MRAHGLTIPPPDSARPMLIALLGLAALYLPVYWEASNGLWTTEEYGHVPLILLVVVWLFWRVRGEVGAAATPSSALWGWPALALGMGLYLFGRLFGFSSLEFLSQMFVVAAVLLLLKGVGGLRAAWFAVAYLAFTVPLPASLIDATTGPLKQWISVIMVELLTWAGYPIGRSGVVITVGQYQLLVADACSGMNSMISLSALGTLLVYLLGRTSRIHNALMLASILPIAFAANIVRVVILILITYHLGDEAGQGFLHGAAGVMLIIVSVVLMLGLDLVLERVRSGIGRTT